MKSETTPIVRIYKIVNTIITVVAVVGLIWALVNFQHKKEMEIKAALDEVSQNALFESELYVAKDEETKAALEKISQKLSLESKFRIAEDEEINAVLEEVSQNALLESESRIAKDEEIKAALEKISQKLSSIVSELRVAVVSTDKIQTKANVLENLHKQRADYEKKLKAKLEKEQKAIEKEKEDIEKSQEDLSQEELQSRVINYQRRVNDFQRKLSETAQSIETLYQESLQKIQKEHIDPVIRNIISEKNLSLVIDGHTAYLGKNTKHIDITDEVIDALNKKVSTIKMPTPKGL